MIGTVGGEPRRVAGVGATMTRYFSDTMEVLLSEANAGNFATKAEAIERRNELVKKPPVAPAAAGDGNDID